MHWPSLKPLKSARDLRRNGKVKLLGKSGVTMHVSANRERDVGGMFMREERVGNRR